MSVCPKCARSVEDGWRVCPTCATSLEAATFTQAPVSVPASSSGVEEGRFPAGTVLAGRYRILGLLGRGGMGEVYRAFDQILNQAVALKFLAAGELDEAALLRFRNEVRVARQVSHPNVCRVYDIGFVEGTHFISMEYLDGENLGSLLRRIGRLPQDKAIEFTRKICAGLAAAHERGVLHRDLKPANIMIDGRGQVRITDFGLAAFAQEIPLSDLRSGTPAYMSPEQRAGKEVTTRSDLYSLGLVLYEMFTGKRRGESQSSPTDVVKDLDPAVERVILRCLEEDPRRRPLSALNVSMALPGADPVAAALAAGETPSPEMVAASEGKEGFRPRTAVACFAAVVIAALIGMALTNRTSLFGHVPLPIPPDGLAFRAQEILKRLGYGEEYRSTAYGFACCSLEAARNAERYGARRDDVLASHRPAVISFWYRRHREEFPSIAALPSFASLFTPGVIGPDAPPNTAPGMIRLQLDPTGRLTGLEIRPWMAPDGPRDPPDWTSLFAAAELDPARFKLSAPERIPPMAFDERQSWTGTYGDDRPEQVRVEAALWRGRPVFFEETLASTPTRDRLAPVSNSFSRVTGSIALALVGCLVATSFTARRNLRLGRSDRRGAAVLAGTAFCLLMVKWVLIAGHVASVAEIGLLLLALCVAVFGAGTLWLFYIAIEPYVRRNWPDALISWTRFQNGQLRNPLVASHVLAGLVAGSFFERVALPGMRIVFSTPFTRADPPFLLLSFDGIAHNLGMLLGAGYIALALGLALLVFVVLLRLCTPRLWIADLLGSLVFTVLLGGLGILGDGRWQVAGGFALFLVTCLTWMRLLRHLGFLAVLVTFAHFVTRLIPPVLTGWLAVQSVTLQLMPAVLAAAALWAIVSAERRPATE